MAGSVMSDKTDPRLVCRNCQFLFVTHDAGRPWGCSAFGFKSPQLPGLVVNLSTGMKCAKYEVKQTGDGKNAKPEKGILA